MQVSEVGLGCEFLQGKDSAHIKTIIDEAMANGINLFDVFMSEPDVRSNLGEAFLGRRDKVILQGHIGSVWKDGQYAVSRDLAECKANFEDLLTRLQTDYIDIGMIHFVDTVPNYDAVFFTEILEYTQDLHKKGIIKCIGLSSHNALQAKRAVETDLIDVLMFSLNPAFDMMPPNTNVGVLCNVESENEALKGTIDPERAALYHACEKHGTAITVMKAYLGGRLLDPEKSPFPQALTPVQCLHYALTRPAVASVLPGCVTIEDIRQAVSYSTASDAEKDFSVIFCKPAA
jgi:hypothetical protein